VGKQASFHAIRAAYQLALAILISAVFVSGTDAQQRLPQTFQFHVSKTAERLDMVVNTSRILKLDSKIPRVFVNDPGIIRATPLAEDQVQVSALKPGVTQLNMWDQNGKVYTVDVVVTRDARELIDVLKADFPDATLQVRPVGSAVYITGYVPRAEMIDEIISVAEQLYDRVINGITVGGVQQVALHVKVMEVSRTKARECGIDWEFLSDQVKLSHLAHAKISDATLRIGLFGDTADLTCWVNALRKHNLVKILAEPTLVTVTGRPARFVSGGSFPILVPNGLGTISVEFKTYGTIVDFVPIILGNGNIRLEVRPSVSEVDESRGVELEGIRVPGLTERHADTAVEMRAGQTLALAGLIQQRVEAETTGIPYLADLPWLGKAFSYSKEKTNEVELLIIVTPEFIGPMEPHQTPCCGPGQVTVSPNDHELYKYNYVEVPNCCVVNRALEAAHTPTLAPPVEAAPAVVLPPGAERLPDPDAPPSTAPPSTAGMNRPANVPISPPAARTIQAAYPARPTGPRTIRPMAFGPSGHDPL
jgi:pilus assembly protein CpaC